MNEQLPQEPQINPLEMSRAYAGHNEEVNSQMGRLHNEWLGSQPGEVNKNTAQDVADYLGGRPDVYTEGSTRHTLKVEKHDLAENDFSHDQRRTEHEAETRGKTSAQKSLNELIKDWAKADDGGDKTIANDVQDEIVKRLENDSDTSDEDKVRAIDDLYMRKESLRKHADFSSDNKDKRDNGPTPGMEVVPYKRGELEKPSDKKDDKAEIVPKDDAAIEEAPKTLDNNDPELVTASEAIDVARDKLAAAAAHRRRRLFSLKGQDSQENYDQAKKEYLAACAGYMKVYCGKLREAGIRLTNDETKIVIDAKMTNEHKQLADKQQEILEGTKFGKFMAWYNKGGKVRKTAINLGLGVTGGVVAGVTGLAGGAIGLGVGVGAGVSVAIRFARGFVGSSSRRLKDSRDEDDSIMRGKVDDVITSMNPDGMYTSVTDTLDSRIAKDQKSMRRAVIAGAGTVAAGAALGYIAHGFFGGHGGGKHVGGSKNPSGTRPSTPRAVPHAGVDHRAADIAKFRAGMSAETNRIAGVNGAYPWDRAASLYGPEHASTRLIQTVNHMRANGANVQWHGNPLTSRTAWISVDGRADTGYVWGHMANAMAAQDFENYVNAAK